MPGRLKSFLPWSAARRTLAAASITLLLAAVPRENAEVTHPYAGVTYIDRLASMPRPVHMHIVQIDLRTPGLRFKVSPPGGSRETVRQRTVDYLRQEGAQSAINGHFFLPFPSDDTDAWTIGLAASEGRLYSAFESPAQSFAIVAAVLIKDYRVWNAINLDGGGSTTVAWQNPATGAPEMLNTSSDSPEGRSVASSLAVFARRR